MVKCPFCKEEVEHLRFEAQVQHFGIYQKDYVNGEDWDTRELGDWTNIEFFCSECGSKIAETQEEADKFFEKENKD